MTDKRSDKPPSSEAVMGKVVIAAADYIGFKVTERLQTAMNYFDNRREARDDSLPYALHKFRGSDKDSVYDC